MPKDDAKARRTREAFEANQLYPIASISRAEQHAPKDYINRLLSAKLETVRRHTQKGLLVDLCCATGDHIGSIQSQDQRVIGIDFSIPFLKEAKSRQRDVGIENLSFVAADARSLPLAGESVATLYSLSSLYVVPELERVVAEIARVLKPHARCILDLGNVRSLNSFCVRRYYPELIQSYHVSVERMYRLFSLNNLRVIEHRAFQLLPMWAGRPKWLLPLLHPFWTWLLAKQISGVMLDERISSFSLFKPFAFRHLIVCEKC